MTLLSPVRSFLAHRRAGRRSVGRLATRRARLLVDGLEDRTVPAKLFVVTPDAPLDATHFASYHDAFSAAASGDVIQFQHGTAMGSVGADIVGTRQGGGEAGSSRTLIDELLPAVELVPVSGGGGAREV